MLRQKMMMIISIMICSVPLSAELNLGNSSTFCDPQFPESLYYREYCDLEPAIFPSSYCESDGMLLIYMSDSDCEHAEGSFLEITIYPYDGAEVFTQTVVMSESSPCFFSNSNEQQIPIEFGDIIEVNYIMSPEDNGNNMITIFDCNGTNDVFQAAPQSSGIIWSGPADCLGEPYIGSWEICSGPGGSFSDSTSFQTEFLPSTLSQYELCFSPNCTDTVFTFTVSYLQPTIFSQPEDISAPVEGTVSYEVNTEGGQCQWQKNDGLGWVDLSDSEQYNGTSSQQLVVSNIQAENHGEYFRCRVSVSDCYLLSENAILLVCSELYSHQVQSHCADPGNEITLSAFIPISTAQYQWQTCIGSGWVDLFNSSQYSGVNSAELTISDLNIINDGQLFRCHVITDGCHVMSNVTIISVHVVGLIELTELEVSVAPNPTHSTVTISGSGLITGVDYSIFDSLGSLKETGVFKTNSRTFNLEEFPSGTFFIVLESGGVRISKRIVLL
jgi:hypothetical protein